MTRRRLALAAAILLCCAAVLGAQTQMPDWSGQWEIVGVTLTADGRFGASLDQVLKEMQWSPPNKPEVQARVDQIVALQRKSMDAEFHGAEPPATESTCTWGFPIIMLDSPAMFEVLPTPRETVLIFSGREVRHVYTDGREHTPKDELWPTPWGDSVGHWEGQTLFIDTIAVKSPEKRPGDESVPIVAIGGGGEVEFGMQLIAYLSPHAQFIERIRMVDKDHLEDQMTIIDPVNFTAPWHLSRAYRRVANVHRMIYEDCEGEDRNPIVNGHYTLAPPPGSPAPPPAATTSAPAAQFRSPR
jgi:hypothetical protein